MDEKHICFLAGCFACDCTCEPAGFSYVQMNWPSAHTSCAASSHMQPYRSWRGSQSTPGSSSLAACRTSSLSTEKLRLCSVWTTATRTHSIRGGSTINGLEGEIEAHVHRNANEHTELKSHSVPGHFYGKNPPNTEFAYVIFSKHSRCLRTG